MKTKFFVDTNLLLYGYDKDAKEKHEMAVTWLKQLWETKTGIISTQVLQARILCQCDMQNFFSYFTCTGERNID